MQRARSEDLNTSEKRSLSERAILLVVSLGACLASNPMVAEPPTNSSARRQPLCDLGPLRSRWSRQHRHSSKADAWRPYWAVKSIVATHNPPANRFGSEGPSPNNYFADELIAEGKATDVVLLKCSGASPRRGLAHRHQGGDRFPQGCAKRVKYAVETWRLKLSRSCNLLFAGDATDELKARDFPDNYKKFASASPLRASIVSCMVIVESLL